MDFQKASIIETICMALADDRVAEAKRFAIADYPFQPASNPGRNYTAVQSTRIFVRDGFVDRYSGDRLVFPGTLRLLSTLMPAEFPFHKNWKMTETHMAYWELFPTVDHVVPVARGGSDAESNWMTTSMLRNSAKSNWTLDELGWQLLPAGDLNEWDGLMGWFLKVTGDRPEVLSTAYLKIWHRAATLVCAGT